MELSDILTLVKAGYTREEIAQMEKPATPNPAPVVEPTPTPAPVAEPAPAPVVVPVAVPTQQPVQQPVQAPTQQPVQAPTQQPVQAPAEPTMAELMQSIAKLTSAVQANAIAQSVIPGGATPQTPNAEDMLAEIIRPTYKERT